MTEKPTCYEDYGKSLLVARNLSVEYPGKVFRVYGTTRESPEKIGFLVRHDKEPLASVDGKDIHHIAAFLDGELVRP